MRRDDERVELVPVERYPCLAEDAEGGATPLAGLQEDDVYGDVLPHHRHHLLQHEQLREVQLEADDAAFLRGDVYAEICPVAEVVLMPDAAQLPLHVYEFRRSVAPVRPVYVVLDAPRLDDFLHEAVLHHLLRHPLLRDGEVGDLQQDALLPEQLREALSRDGIVVRCEPLLPPFVLGDYPAIDIVGYHGLVR